jgi:hypothetical protein
LLLSPGVCKVRSPLLGAAGKDEKNISAVTLPGS